MSLNVMLFRDKWTSNDDGKTHTKENEVLFNSNITHDLNEMADRAGFYDACWRPYRLHKNYIETNNTKEEAEFERSVKMTADDILATLEIGFNNLKLKPDYFKLFDSTNGNGVYDDLVSWTEKYLNACREYPDATIKVVR